jgi:hypothetical protein
MTDYNDGAWHGWNGGECPVHPESVIKYELRAGAVCEHPAGKLAWCHAETRSDIIHFRVIRPYVAPREGWIVPGQLYDSARQAKIAHPGVDPIRVKEVKE